MAAAFAAEGAKVAVLSRNEQSCGHSANAINEKYPDSARSYAVDVADFGSMQECGKEILAEMGGVDILINNAGITRDGLLLRMSDEDWDAVLGTNLKGAFNSVKAFQRSLMKADEGRIINVSSVIGLIGNAGQANYAASKAGMIGFTKSLAQEVASRGITANTIAPGFIESPMTDVLPEKQKEALLGQIPAGRLGQGADIAAAAVYLASDQAAYVTGQTIHVNGGMAMI